MSRALTLAGYVVAAVAAGVVEVTARTRRRWATLSGAVARARSAAAGRLLLGAAWLWLGWHLFVRVEWR